MTSMNVRAWMCVAAASALALCGCKTQSPQQDLPQKPPGLEAQPERLAFLCVTPGCDEKQTVNVHVNGTRRAAIKRILLKGDASDDFTFTSSEEPPFIVGPGAGFEVEVEYAPKGAPVPGSVEVLVTYTDASPDEDPNRLEPGELSVPLVRRIVGEPILTANPDTLSFGVVAPGTDKTLPLHVSNDGFGNVAVQLATLEAGAPEVQAELPMDSSFAPGSGVDLPVKFSAMEEKYVSTTLTLTPTSKDVVPAVVKVEGTSLSVPQIGIEPQADIDFGELAKGKQRSLSAMIVNRGGENLTLQGISVNDPTGNITVTAPMITAPLVIAPLERVPLGLSVNGTASGNVNAVVTLTSDDPASSIAQMHLTGVVTEPKLSLTPASLDFGTVPTGWVVKKPVELRNVGYGALTVKNITLVAGSSNLFTLSSLPALPLELERNQRIAVDVEFRAETGANFKGWLSVETDDPENPFLEVPLTALAGTCQQSCPISHGTPDCGAGTCAIGTCDSGWFDTDQSAATGCECKEVANEPGEFCADSKWVGNLTDDNADQAQQTGLIPLESDMDVYRFFAVDGFTWFGENYDVRIRLDSGDPHIKMCVYRFDTGSHQTDCYWTNETCPANRQYQHGGSAGGGDDADFIVKVFRDPGVGPTCTGYTLFMSNGL